MNLGLQLILGGMIRRAIAEPTAVDNFRLARNAVENILAVESFTINLTANRAVGPSPFVVSFDAFNGSIFPGIERPLHECSFWFDYGDPGSTYKNISPTSLFGNDANVSQGPYGAHVYLTPGSYTAKVYVYHHPTNKFGYAEITVEAQSIEAFFGTNIVCFSQSGNFTEAPAGALQATTFAELSSASSSLGDVNKAFLFRRGEDITGRDTEFANGSSREWLYGTYGSGDAKANFILAPGGMTSTYKNLFRMIDSGIKTITGIKVVGDYDPATGAGDHWNTAGVRIQNAPNVAVYDCDFGNMGSGVFVDQTNRELVNPTVIDCNIHGWRDIGVFSQGDAERLSIFGNSIKQNLDTVSGEGAKENGNSGEITLDGVQTTFTLPKLRIFSNTDNLYLAIRDPATKVPTELIIGVDFTFNAGSDATPEGATNGAHSVTLNSPGVSGDLLVYYTRRWADHGPIRIAVSRDVGYFRNDLRSMNGWSDNGQAFQSCIRDNSSAVLGARSYTTQNLMQGGGQVMVVTPQDFSLRQYASDAVIDTNYLQGDSTTQEAFMIRASGVTIRNCIFLMPNIVNTFAGGYRAFIKLERTATTETDIADRPIRFYNNTSICLVSTANGAIDAEIVRYEGGSDSFFTNVDVQNTLMYHPDAPTPWPNYEPLDSDNYYRPMEGSAALNAGTPVGLVWDDLAGDLTGETLSIGAFNTVAPVTNTYFTDFSTDTIGQQPANTTLKHSGVTGDYVVVDDGGVKVLKSQAASGTAARGLAFPINSEGVVEIYFLAKDNASNPPSLRALAYGTDTLVSEYGVVLNDTTNSLITYRRVSGTYAEVQSSVQSIVSNTYYHVLFRLTPGSPNRLQAKYWLDGSAEPGTWLLDQTNENLTLTSGWVGLGGNASNAPCYIKKFGIGINGQPAPRS